ncbi:MAG: zinc-binding protein [Polaromonas sp.]|jgi:uncharacterized metal-binding protein|nr:zinc-binding protein [Polaromonas sp.]MDB5938172.1 zinc-binding protein [Polaromonas sp.]
MSAGGKPLVYSCSGCSSAAQLANHVAVRLDRSSVAEMSCIAGVGGDVPSLLKTARSGRRIIALDGCPLACVKSSLARHGLVPDRHYQLQDYGVRKRQHEDFDPVQADAVLERVKADLFTDTESPGATPISNMNHTSSLSAIPLRAAAEAAP